MDEIIPVKLFYAPFHLWKMAVGGDDLMGKHSTFQEKNESFDELNISRKQILYLFIAFSCIVSANFQLKLPFKTGE